MSSVSGIGRIVVVALVLVAGLAAQAERRGVPEAPTPPAVHLSSPEELTFFAEEDGTQWIVGAIFKAALGPSGFQFVPFLGSDAPRNFPIEFGHPILSLDGNSRESTRSEVRRNGLTLSRDHGLIEERYVANGDQIEQQFVIRALLRGEITVSYAVATELWASTKEDGFAFEGPYGGIGISGAFLIDSDGVRTPLALDYDSGRMTITIPASVVADSRFPITIDPIITTIPNLSAGSNASVGKSDCAFLGYHRKWAVTWERIWSATDRDVASVLLDFDGNIIPQSLVWQDASQDNFEGPKVAANANEAQFLIVMTKGLASLGNRAVFGSRRFADLPSTGDFVWQISPSGSECFEPVIGGDNDPFINYPYAVVWTRKYSLSDHDIHARLVGTSGITSLANVIVLDNSGSDDRAPSMSIGCGSMNGGQRWQVVWERQAATQKRICARTLFRNGTLSANVVVLTTGVASEYRPRVTDPFQASGGPVGVMLAWTRELSPTVKPVMVSFFDGVSLASEESLQFLASRPTADQTAYSIATDGCRFTVVYSESAGIGFSNVYATTIGLLGIGSWGVQSTHQPIATAPGPDGDSAIVSAFSGAVSGPIHLVTWTATPILPGANATIQGALYSGANPLNNVRHGFATEGLVLDYSGEGALGQLMHFRLLNSTNSPTLVFGLPTTPFTACGNLQIGVDLFSNPIILPTNSQFLVVPCAWNLLGLTFAVQGADLDGSSCHSLRVSDAVWIQIH